MMLTPGVSRGTSTIDCWRCFEASGSVLPMTMKTAQRGSAAPEAHHFLPLITYSSPSRRIEVVMLVASEDATSGSVIANAERISPASSGTSQSCFCSAVPNRCSVSMLPVSGAWQLIASGAITGDQPVTSATAAYSRLVRPDSEGRKRFHSPRSRASDLRVSTTGGQSCSAGVPRRCSRQASYSASIGRIDSSRKARIRFE